MIIFGMNYQYCIHMKITCTQALIANSTKRIHLWVLYFLALGIQIMMPVYSDFQATSRNCGKMGFYHNDSPMMCNHNQYNLEKLYNSYLLPSFIVPYIYLILVTFFLCFLSNIYIIYHGSIEINYFIHYFNQRENDDLETFKYSF